MDKDQPASTNPPLENDPYLPQPAAAAPAAPVNTPDQPMPPSTFTNLAPHDSFSVGKKSRRGLLIGIILVVVLLLLGAGAYATFVRQTPEKEIKKAFANMAELDSFALDGSLTSNGGFSGTLSGQFDGKAEAFNMQLSASVLLNTMKLDLVGVGDTLYFKTQGVVELAAGFVGLKPADTAKIKQLLESKYIRVTPEDVPSQLLGQEPGAGMPATPEISEADQDKITQLIEDTEFFKVSEKLGNKDIHGTSATGYKIVLQAEGMRQLARGLKDIESLKPAFANQDQEKFDQALVDINQADLDKVPFEVWLSGDRIAQVAIEMAEGQSKGRFELSFSRFNESFDIKAPADTRPFSEVIPGLQSTLSELGSGTGLTVPSTLQ
jgi:hypothetical protein